MCLSISDGRYYPYLPTGFWLTFLYFSSESLGPCGMWRRDREVDMVERHCRPQLESRSHLLSEETARMYRGRGKWLNGKPLRWRHNGCAGVSNYQPHDCLLNCLFRRRSKKTSKLRVTGLCEGNLPVAGEFPAQTASYAENVCIWRRHHEYVDGLVQERRNSSALAMELRLSCINT